MAMALFRKSPTPREYTTSGQIVLLKRDSMTFDTNALRERGAFPFFAGKLPAQSDLDTIFSFLNAHAH
jgi:hypothetical protein